MHRSSFPAYIARAAAQTARGNTNAAEKDLMVAAIGYDSARAALASAALQWSLQEQARSVYDSLVMLHVRRGESARALATHETSRQLWTSRHQGASMPAGRPSPSTVVDFALVGNELISWTIGTSDTTFAVKRIDRASFRARIERVRTSLELGVSEARLRPDLSALYDELLREPLRGRTAKSVVVVPDREIADVPVSARRGPKTKTYVTERFQVTLSPSLAATARSVTTSTVGPALVISIPSWTPGSFRVSYLSPAQSARRCECVICTELRNSPVQMQTAHTWWRRCRVRQWCTTHGHAVFDDAQPWRSALAVKPRGLTANAISTLDLHGVRLVVLSACETMRAPDQRGSGFAGLSDAFLAAGAGGVIGSLWRVNDSTAVTLMLRFHEEYRTRRDAAGALQKAQQAAIREGVSPSGWAAFRYYGTN